MKLLHTADIHLGAKFSAVTDPPAFRRQLRDTFTRIIDLALSEKVDILLVAGDLFDSSRPSPDLIRFVSQQLQRLSQIPVCLIPGTHDNQCYKNSSLPVNVLDSIDWCWKEFPRLDLTVYGINPQTQYPLKDFGPRTASRYQVALLHAGFEIPDKVRDEHLVRVEDINGCQLDYLALGHWHRLADYSAGKTGAWYPGSPEPMAIDEEGSGSIVIVDLVKKSVQPYQVGALKCDKMELEVGGIDDLEKIKKVILSGAACNLRRKVRLKGFSLLPLDNLETELAADFGQLRVVNDTHLPPEKLDPGEYKQHPFAREFLLLMREEINKSSAADRQVAEKARDYGITLLEGGEIL